jgi:hypothetical protein
VDWTAAAGTISQTTRGLSSFATRSASEAAPTMPSSTSRRTVPSVRAYPTHWWPSRISRRTRLAPILPRPTMPTCIGLVVVMDVFPLTIRRRPFAHATA